MHPFQGHHQGSSLPHMSGGGYYGGSPVSPTSATHPTQQHGFYPSTSGAPGHIPQAGYQAYPPIPPSPSSAHRPLDPSLQGPDQAKGRKRKAPDGSTGSPGLGPPPGSAGSGIIPLANTATPPPPTGQMLNPGQNSEDEPLYVNAKQYHRILKRRAARAKIEEGNKGNKNKKVLPQLRMLEAVLMIAAISSRITPQARYAASSRPWRSVPHRRRNPCSGSYSKRRPTELIKTTIVKRRRSHSRSRSRSRRRLNVSPAPTSIYQPGVRFPVASPAGMLIDSFSFFYSLFSPPLFYVHLLPVPPVLCCR
jgi:CCAAT-binding transcription factor (CBF-B/NF-YA) subunit B